ncbi:MAG: HAMP domain-containing histidine kinase [Thaumarchaeota archaeon]|nr:HAMP domain-containing histidine kinase [Nitrososphaerota archaeon]
MPPDTCVEILFSDPGQIFVEADKERVTQIVTNLIHNALKFTRDGTITVALKKGKDEVTVSIKDTGMEIDPDIMSAFLPSLQQSITAEQA